MCRVGMKSIQTTYLKCANCDGTETIKIADKNDSRLPDEDSYNPNYWKIEHSCGESMLEYVGHTNHIVN